MKIFEPVMLIFQYAYYWSIKWDKFTWNGGLPNALSRYIALFWIGATESIAVLTIYIFVVDIEFGLDGRLVPFYVYVSALGVYSYLLVNINEFILGPVTRISHYKRIFDSWGKAKHLLWKSYIILLVVFVLASFKLTLDASDRNEKRNLPPNDKHQTDNKPHDE
jgi:hypothetical protein